MTGGEVTGARRLEPDSATPNIRWEITVMPDGNGDVTIALPVTSNCEAQGAICTEDGRMLSNRTELTVQVPAPANSAATGAPTIGGTVQVGETLSADTSGVSDEDGLDNASFSYQWLADDTDIAGATGSSYTLTDSDEGKAIRVQVSFTDDAGNDETLTSAATAAVAARPNTPATGAPTISGTVKVGHVLTADTTDIADQDGIDNAQFTYQWLANAAAIADATGSQYLLTSADKENAITVKV